MSGGTRSACGPGSPLADGHDKVPHQEKTIDDGRPLETAERAGVSTLFLPGEHQPHLRRPGAFTTQIRAHQLPTNASWAIGQPKQNTCPAREHRETWANLDPGGTRTNANWSRSHVPVVFENQTVELLRRARRLEGLEENSTLQSTTSNLERRRGGFERSPPIQRDFRRHFERDTRDRIENSTHIMFVESSARGPFSTDPNEAKDFRRRYSPRRTIISAALRSAEKGGQKKGEKCHLTTLRAFR
jgi:hypothetical protein